MFSYQFFHLLRCYTSVAGHYRNDGIIYIRKYIEAYAGKREHAEYKEYNIKNGYRNRVVG